MDLLLSLLFVFLSCNLYMSYPIVDNLLNKNLKNYYLITNKSKRYYIIKNLLKSLNLCLSSIVFVYYVLTPILIEGAWNDNYNHIGAIFYCVNDFVGLLRVDKLPRTTKIHHILSTTLCIYSTTLSYQKFSVARLMFVYCMCSGLTFSVNAYLGLRYLYPCNLLRQFSLYFYAGVCFFNWSWHIYYTLINYYLLDRYILIYYLLLINIVRDDLILMSWLHKKHVIVY